MAMDGEALWALPVMWSMTGLVFLFLLLRVYTRVVCLSSYGLDDQIYIAAFVFLVIFNIFTHLAANHGFGQTPDEIGNIEEVVRATLFECIGQGFAIVGMAIAKWSMGFFLLRIVTLGWHKVAIWTAMVLVGLASIAQVLCFWLSCVPFDYVYDRRIEGGYCPIDMRPTSYILCVSTILVDTFFAIFPWVFIWKLQMPKRDKITIAASMSFGLFAAAAGIKRTVEVEGLYTENYLRDSVGLIVWSAAEMAITMICVGIPVCRPLYKRLFYRFTSENASSGYQKQNEERSSSVPLRTIGGGMVGGGGRPLPQSKTDTTNKSDTDDLSFKDAALGIKGSSTRTQVSRGDIPMDNTSDEEILGEEFRKSQIRQTEGRDYERHGEQEPRLGGILVTETYNVDRS
ncbi:hypothetical protein HER10_EVM0002379 [Colletotrichum scovillei]|uniref:uncharacterized protein n=1 Tax=Colletotrichum scovillei TaxID=1209932 RepID=UPI0015C334EB|nr:uncharacterized protein HER10_EVM0002379 [Colletotrichum scovillei]KAF4774681.1 hypothetical protein HER10_EVM0002379 [Colletotrichum scovillei]